MGLVVDAAACRMSGGGALPRAARARGALAAAPAASTTAATTSPGTRSNTELARWQVKVDRPRE